VLGCFLIQASLLSQAEDAPRLLLREVAAKYESLTSYQVEVRSTVKSHLEDEPASKFHYSLAAGQSGERLVRQQLRTPQGQFELLLVTDGSQLWGYSPVERRYVAKRYAQAAEERSEIQRLHENFIGRFQLLDRLDLIVTRNKNGSIRIEPKSERERWIEELWLDPATRLVRKSRLRTRPALPWTGWITTTSEWSGWNMSPNQSIFQFQPPSRQFQPPAGAREASSLAYR
jgi:hypothetical protein